MRPTTLNINPKNKRQETHFLLPSLFMRRSNFTLALVITLLLKENVNYKRC